MSIFEYIKLLVLLGVGLLVAFGLGVLCFLYLTYLMARLSKEKKMWSYFTLRLKKYRLKKWFGSYVFLMILDNGFMALLMYRIANRVGNKVLGALMTRLMKFLTGIEIYFNAKIGKSLDIWHGTGLVIGQNTRIGDDCLLLHQVTFGSGAPQLGNRIKVGAGAKVFGTIDIGDDVVIGANSVVTHAIPAYSLVTGMPARVVKKLNSSEDISFGTKED